MSEELNRFKKMVSWFQDIVFGTKPKRARTKTGKFKADDKSTKGVNEAWVGGKSPKKKTRKRKKK